MKSTGVTRPIDHLGRVVIPKELRDSMGLKTTDRMEFFVEGDKIIIKSYVRGCHCCGEQAVTEILGIALCNDCIDDFESARSKINKLR